MSTCTQRLKKLIIKLVVLVVAVVVVDDDDGDVLLTSSICPIHTCCRYYKTGSYHNCRYLLKLLLSYCWYFWIAFLFAILPGTLQSCLYFRSWETFLISNFRYVLNVVWFLLRNSPASEFYMPTFRNTLFLLHRQAGMKYD